MMRRLLVYWHCPRDVVCRGLLVVILKGFYPGWLRFHCPAVRNLFTIVCARRDSNLLERSRHSATHSFSLSAQELMHPSLTCMTNGHLARAREKQNKTAERKREVVALCWRPQRSQILKALLQKDMHCLASV